LSVGRAHAADEGAARVDTGRHGLSEAALALLSRSPAPRSCVACNAALHACERSGRAQLALELLASMEADGPPPDDCSLRTVVFSCLSAAPALELACIGVASRAA
jgi:pentatricopeptide repeat protein